MQDLFKILLVLQLFASCSGKQCDEERVIKIGHILISNDASKNTESSFPDIVFLGDGIKEQLQMLRDAGQPYRYSVENGDLKEPYGDNSSDCILDIVSGGHTLRVRLRYNRSRDQYDIKGWTSNYPIKVY